MKYNKNINYLRGVGILLVLIGHSFPSQDFNNNYFYEYLHKFIYSFHMPLFFFLSGFCAIKIYSLTENIDILNFYKGKFFRLIIPYFSITTLTIPVKIILNNFSERPLIINDLIKNIFFVPIDAPIIFFWFIYALFIIFLIVPIIIKIPVKIALPLLLLISVAVPSTISIMAFSKVTANLIFFYLGLLCNKYSKKIHLENIFLNMLLLALLIILNLFDNNNILTIIEACIGISLSINLVYLIKNQKILNTLDKLGTYSYSIYLFSWFFQTASRIVSYQILHLNYFLCILIIFFSGFLSITVHNLLNFRNNKILPFLFLGNYKPLETNKIIFLF